MPHTHPQVAVPRCGLGSASGWAPCLGSQQPGSGTAVTWVSWIWESSLVSSPPLASSFPGALDLNWEFLPAGSGLRGERHPKPSPSFLARGLQQVAPKTAEARGARALQSSGRQSSVCCSAFSSPRRL